jgi:hypothetical protein
MRTRRKGLPSATDPPLDLRSWHDNAVHALHLTDVNPDNGTSTMTLDIDHIVEWILKPKTKFYEFRIAPALLRFYGVFALKVTIDYSVGPIAVMPFQIDGIERSPIDNPYTDAKSFRWTIRVNSPRGELTFDAHDWSLTFTGPAVSSKNQVLSRATSRVDV